MMSTYDGNTASNFRSAMKFSPSIETDEKMNESDFKGENKNGRLEDVDLGEDPTLIMKSRETSERCESISQSYRSESKVAVTSSRSCTKNDESPASP